MHDRRTLIVYYSRTGITRKVAENLAAKIRDCDVEGLVDTKDRGGVKGWLVGAKDGLFKSETEIKPVDHNLAFYDLVIVGTPVWAGGPTPAVRTYLAQHADRLPEAVAFFATAGSSGFDGTFAQMTTVSARSPIARLPLTTKAVRRNECAEQIAAFIESLPQ